MKRYTALLSKVDESVLREHLDFPQMDRLYFAIDTWQDEGEELFLEYVVPLFERLKQFYCAAADAGQCVLVWYN